MSWIEKTTPTPFDDQPPEGFYYLDGDILVLLFKRDWTKGQKFPMIAFPSGVEREIWESGNPEAGGIVHLFGELDLPFKDTRDSAFEDANYIAEQCGYLARRVGENGLELWGHDEDEHLLVTYDRETGRMVDVALVHETEAKPRPKKPLLDETSRERLPSLYSGEEQGLETLAQVKFFLPGTGWTWYASEGSLVDEDGFFDTNKDKVDFLFFGLVAGLEVELGYFSLSELEQARGPLGLPVERDRFFEPTSLRELQEQHRRERGE